MAKCRKASARRKTAPANDVLYHGRMSDSAPKYPLNDRFRGFLPVVVDVETGGFDCSRHALLEIAAAPIEFDDNGQLAVGKLYSTHVIPFDGSEIDPKSLEVTGIDISHPFRDAKDERSALDHIFLPIRQAAKRNHCTRAILVGHNASFDLGFLNAAVARVGHKRTLDTVTLAAMAYGQTVLSKAVIAAGMDWNNDDAHSAVYDTERTAQLFCKIVNGWGKAP